MKNKIPVNSMIFDLLSSCNNNFIFIGDLKTKELQWSKNSFDFFAIEETETKDPNIWEKIIWKEDVLAFEKAIEEFVADKKDQLQSEFLIRTKQNTAVSAQVYIWPITEENNITYYAGIISSLSSQNTITSLTGMKSIYDFREELASLIQKKAQFGILAIGIDSLKRINDMHSYTFGDEVLKKFALELEKRISITSSLYRLDGDGVGILYRDTNKLELLEFFVKFQEILLSPFIVQDIQVSFNIFGAACVYPDDANDVDELLKSMRIALNIAKNSSGNHFVSYTKELAEQAQREQQLMYCLKESINHKFTGFQLKYQPLIFAETGKLYGCEVLLRWKHKDFPEGVTPTEFIPLIENMGLIIRVGKWVLQEALIQLSKWVKIMPTFQMSINAASAQFEDPEFRFFVMDCLCREKLNPNLLTLELTESDQISDTEAISHAFDFFRGQGIKIAFDDFGMGYGSFDIFRVLSADELKIDKSFLERLTYDVVDQKIIAHIISLCNSMNMYVCVEGVETNELANIIRQLGPKFLQGYYYNKPMTAEEFENFYLKNEQLETKEIAVIDASPEVKQTMVYSEYKPAQPLSPDDLIDTIHAGIIQVGMDSEFTFLTCNEGYRKMLGYTAKEIDDKFKNKALGFVHPDDMENVNKEIRHQLGMGDTVTIEFRVVRADDTPLWILGTGNVVKAKNGTSSLSVVIINNDEIKKCQLKVEANAVHYKRILDRMPTGMKCVRYDEKFTLDYISPSFLSIMGYNESEIHTLFHDNYINLIYEEDREQLIDDIFEQLKNSNVVTLHYRSRCKDGRLIWLQTVSRLCPPDEDGIQRCYSNVIDITDTISDAEKQKSRSLANRYQEAAARWGDVLFEINCSTYALHFSDEYQTMFNRNPEDELFKEFKYIHPEDRNLIKETLQKAIEGYRCAPIEIRALKDHNYRWYTIYIDEPEKLGNTNMMVLGKICDINDEKIERDKLLEKVQEDSLTGLLNKVALEEKIRLILGSMQPWEEYALYMIDIDNFKDVNNKMGHPFGDNVLREISRKLKDILEPSALIGRAGGDEFMALVKLNDGMNSVKMAEQIVQKLKGKFELSQHHMFISISVGGSLCPIDGLQFYDLFRRADSALYRAKARGKNQSCMFSGE